MTEEMLLSKNIQEYKYKSSGPRAEMIRRARQSCLKNYCGDTMKSREEIIKELEEREKMNLSSANSKNTHVGLNRMQEYPLEQNTLQLSEARDESIPQPGFESGHMTEFTQGDGQEVISTGGGKSSGYRSNEQVIETPYMYDNFYTSIQNPPKDVNVYGNGTAAFDGVALHSDSFNETKGVIPQKALEEKKQYHLLVLRCVITLLLLAGFICMDQFKITFYQLTSDQVVETIKSTQAIEKLEEFMVNIAQK